MVLFSRTFVRKRVISLATTVAVSATSFAFAEDPVKTHHVRGTVPIQYAADRPDHPEEQPFLSENDAAMNKMMMDMAVKPSGNVDADFTAMMIPHHQGAVDMAEAELHHGHNRKLRRIARNIIAGQRQQIGAMRAALGQPLSEVTSSAAQSGQDSQVGARSARNTAR